MKYFLPTLLLLVIGFIAKSQTVDSIYVNLYTDSLKKGTYNYINVDGRLTNGKYLPLDSTQIIFKSSHGKFSGNSLWLEPDCMIKSINILVCLRNKPMQEHKFTMYVKTKPDDEQLKTAEEIMYGDKKKKKKD